MDGIAGSCAETTQLGPKIGLLSVIMCLSTSTIYWFLFISLLVSQSVSLFIYLFIYVFIYLCIYVFMYLFVYLFIYLSIYRLFNKQSTPRTNYAEPRGSRGGLWTRRRVQVCLCSLWEQQGAGPEHVECGARFSRHLGFKVERVLLARTTADSDLRNAKQRRKAQKICERLGVSLRGLRGCKPKYHPRGDRLWWTCIRSLRNARSRSWALRYLVSSIEELLLLLLLPSLTAIRK